MSMDRNIVYMIDTIEVRRRQLQIKNVDKDKYFCPSTSEYKGGSVHHPMKSKESFDLYKVGEVKLVSFVEENLVWNEDPINRKRSFVGSVQIFSDMRETKLKCSVLIVLTVQPVLLSFSIHFGR